jgi:hypothetical protein
MDKATGLVLHVAGLAETVNAWKPYCSESNYDGSNPSIGIYIFLFWIYFILTNAQLKLCSNTSII